MDHCEVEICKVQEPVSLASIQGLRFAEVGQIFVVRENLDWERGTMEIVPPGFESTDDSEEFSVINIVISFCWREGLGEVGAGVPFAV